MAKRIAGDEFSQPEYQVNVMIGGKDPGTTGLIEMLQALIEASDDQALLKAAKRVVNKIESFE